MLYSDDYIFLGRSVFTFGQCANISQIFMIQMKQVTLNWLLNKTDLYPNTFNTVGIFYIQDINWTLFKVSSSNHWLFLPCNSACLIDDGRGQSFSYCQLFSLIRSVVWQTKSPSLLTKLAVEMNLELLSVSIPLDISYTGSFV